MEDRGSRASSGVAARTSVLNPHLLSCFCAVCAFGANTRQPVHHRWNRLV